MQNGDFDTTILPLIVKRSILQDGYKIKKVFHVKDSVAAGLAIGACSHAVGTSKAIEIGEIEGAMSGLAIGICGIITVLFSMLIM